MTRIGKIGLGSIYADDISPIHFKYRSENINLIILHPKIMNCIIIYHQILLWKIENQKFSEPK